MSKLSYKTRVANGAKVLDEICPDWFEKVDVETLDITSGSNCILGQVFDDWMIGSEKIAEHYGWDYFPARFWQSAHGFQSTAQEAGCWSDDDYNKSMAWLAKRWVQEIAARKAAI